MNETQYGLILYCTFVLNFMVLYYFCITVLDSSFTDLAL